ncbi:hypothetical protein ACWGJ2_16910 [Streptomyces sp. NPDC054796]
MRTSTRTLAVAAAVAAGLALTGCGGGSDSGNGDDKADAKPSQEAQPSQQPAGEPGELDGIWGTGSEDAATGGEQEVLTMSQGKAVLVVGKTMCEGAVDSSAQPVTATFKCPDGNKDYAKGTLVASGKKLTVTWASGGKSAMTKKAGASQLPTQMPSGLPSDMATEAPTEAPSAAPGN